MNAILYIRLLRPKQWLKNLMLFFPPFLGGVLLEPGTFMKGVAPFMTFCLASSSMYIFNDIRDADHDRLHVTKRLRPIASGKIEKTVAYVLLVALASIAFALGISISGSSFVWYLLLYSAISVGYSISFKHIPIVDLFCIASGFIIRLMAGGELFAVKVSEWLFLSVLLLSLFLSAGKRLCEKCSMGDDAAKHRKSLQYYPDGFLDGTMFLTGGAVLITYSMYAITRHALVYTVPLCAFGLLRFMLLVQQGTCGDPTDSILKDRTLFGVAVMWAVIVGWRIYGR